MNEPEVITWQMQTIINVANELVEQGSSGASTGERIAAAFVLNDQELLPGMYDDIIEAWDRLGNEWQHYVRLIKRNHMDLINTEYD